MIDFRNYYRDRYHLFTFICGNKYISVLSIAHEPDQILTAVEEFLGELKKPFVLLSQAVLLEEAAAFLRDKELMDIVLE